MDLILLPVTTAVGQVLIGGVVCLLTMGYVDVFFGNVYQVYAES